MTLPKAKNLNGGTCHWSINLTESLETGQKINTLCFMIYVTSIPLVLPIPFSDRFQVI